MDVIAHFLWSFALFAKTKYKWKAGLFGVLPDFLSFGPHFILSIAQFEFVKPELGSIPSYVFIMYNITHSFIPILLLIGIIYFFTKKLYLPFLGWILHILIDIPTHSTEFFPTPFLWPFPTPYVNGFSWGHPYFMILNYTALILVYLFYVFEVHKKFSKN